MQQECPAFESEAVGFSALSALGSLRVLWLPHTVEKKKIALPNDPARMSERRQWMCVFHFWIRLNKEHTSLYK